MLVCLGCDRYVRVADRHCPFCGHGLSTTRARFGGLASVALGMALFGCAGEDDGDDAATTQSSTTQSGTTEAGTDSATSTTTPTGTSTTASETWGEEVSAYGDPSDTAWDTGDDIGTSSDGTTGGTEATGDTTEGTEGTSGTDGTTTGEDGP